jgi:hypothetical protein
VVSVDVHHGRERGDGSCCSFSPRRRFSGYEKEVSGKDLRQEPIVVRE